MMEARTEAADMAFVSSMDLAIPENMGIAHRAVLYDLWEVMATGGTGGKAARGLTERLAEHFAREEDIMGSIFSLGGPDRPGEPPAAELDDIAVMSAFLELELRDLRLEHDELRPLIDELEQTADDSSDPGLSGLALRLKAHLCLEEQVHFPAAYYVGNRLLGQTGDRDA